MTHPPSSRAKVQRYLYRCSCVSVEDRTLNQQPFLQALAHARVRAAQRICAISRRGSSSIKITTPLGHISHCKTAFGTNWSNR